MSKTKAGGSTRNGRDSESKRLGTKVFDGQDISAGSIVIRQRGTKIHPGENVSKGGDDTLFAKIDGVVKYSSRNGRKLVNIIPKWSNVHRQDWSNTFFLALGDLAQLVSVLKALKLHLMARVVVKVDR